MTHQLKHLKAVRGAESPGTARHHIYQKLCEETNGLRRTSAETAKRQ